MKSALFLDFEDSFTFNVVQELNELGLDVKVINWSEFSGKESADLLVLGPGPGHPEEYNSIYPAISSWLTQGKKIFGVCLGHQILWHLKGRIVTRCEVPVHGQKVLLQLNPFWRNWLEQRGEVWVQRYNSLSIKASEDLPGENFSQDGEVLISRDGQTISYQFHPESLGTNCRSAFFRPVLRDLL
jgi:anthranilate/para-aminobenzoate synthase component II